VLVNEDKHFVSCGCQAAVNVTFSVVKVQLCNVGN